MAGQDLPVATASGLICHFDGGTADEFVIDRMAAYWSPEKYAVAVLVKLDDRWSPFGAIWYTDNEPNPLDVGYESSQGLRYELYQLDTSAAFRAGDQRTRTATYTFKERL